MQTADIRSAYLEFFRARGHQVVPSSGLVPANDPTLLFTNAGMVQFKDALAGREDLGFKRAASCQVCVRAGGKHNDLENVGYTARHHTLFEMLGNFSFGDYFKEEAIAWAWEFVTTTLQWGKERLWVTVHPTDAEARALWTKKIGLAPERVIDHPDNFWAMGETGPCGPNTELFYDQGPGVAGGPPGSAEEDGDRFLEFWNLVFPQFDRQPDGELAPLAQPGIDTGLGLERTAALVQGVPANYEVDPLKSLVLSAGGLAGLRDAGEMLGNASLRVIADHIRAAAFLIAEDVLPGNGERNYVLRRIVRRALRHGHRLGLREPFFHRLVAPLAEQMGGAYPRIDERRRHIADALLAEEERFADTLARGMERLTRALDGLADGQLPGAVVFELYDTFGFPTDLTADVARERGVALDMPGFDAAMAAQRARSQGAAQFSASDAQRVEVDSAVCFEGYDALDGPAAVLALYRSTAAGPEKAELLEAGEQGIAVLDRTPFYAEAGGQVGDAGELVGESGRFAVADVTKSGDQHLHRGAVASGALRVGQAVVARVEAERRRAIALNHSATHLLHAALRRALGDGVTQQGSLVAADRLRFDFAHNEAVTAPQLRAIEAEVNDRIRENSPVVTELMAYRDAIDQGAIALFGEKYGDQVRVLTMGDGYSVELCGGTHVRRTGDIGSFAIVSEGGIAAGVRRLEAVTGAAALAHFQAAEGELAAIAGVVKAARLESAQAVGALAARAKSLEKEVEAMQRRLAQAEGTALAAQAQAVAGVKVLGAQVRGDGKALLATLDSLKDHLGSAVIVLGQADAGRVNLIAGVTPDLTHRFKAGDVIAFVGKQVGARGGGRPDMARAGGGDRPEALPAALASVADWVQARAG